MNFANKNFWVPYKANPQGPKRKWLPKSALTSRERFGALVVVARGLEGHTFDAPLSRSFGGKTTMFGVLKHSFLVGNYF